MSKEAVVQIRIDADTKIAAETLYRNLGTSFAEAVRIFAAQSVNEQGFPFVPKNYLVRKKKARGSLAMKTTEEMREKEKDAFQEAMVEKHEKAVGC